MSKHTLIVDVGRPTLRIKVYLLMSDPRPDPRVYHPKSSFLSHVSANIHFFDFRNHFCFNKIKRFCNTSQLIFTFSAFCKSTILCNSSKIVNNVKMEFIQFACVFVWFSVLWDPKITCQFQISDHVLSSFFQRFNMQIYFLVVFTMISRPGSHWGR